MLGDSRDSESNGRAGIEHLPAEERRFKINYSEISYEKDLLPSLVHSKIVLQVLGCEVPVLKGEIRSADTQRHTAKHFSSGIWPATGAGCTIPSDIDAIFFFFI